jgi:alpha-acetolactate decarboxylase
MHLPDQLVANTMCSDMPVSNEMLAISINGRFKWLSVKISPRSHVRQYLLSLETVHYQTLLCIMDISRNMFETKHCTFYWDYLVM